MYFNANTIQRSTDRLYKWHLPQIARMLDGLIMTKLERTPPAASLTNEAPEHPRTGSQCI